MLIHNRNFNIRQIAESGQCFRMNRTEEDGDSYSLVAYGKYLRARQIEEDVVELSCTEEEYYHLWEDYFDLKNDYGRITDLLINGEDPFLRDAAIYGKGIRILRQEPFEATISFIISQNKNIPAIKQCIEGICSRYGERKTCRLGKEEISYHAFPAPEALAAAAREELRALKAGYRDEYILEASRAVADGSINFSLLRQSSYEEAVRTLKTIRGIGDKVANCIALYGLHHIEGFPVDVWILRVLQEVYQGSFPKEKYSGYAGILQQYMFYYMRQLKGVA